MLAELHVKNLALIEKADLELGSGLTVLSGETGAGKSILIDSINVALGGRSSKDIIRTGCDYAYVELLFNVTDEDKLAKIRALDIEPEADGTIIVSRKITPGRSVAKVNDETVSSTKLRELTGLLIDMHGQFEHQSLLNPATHLEYLDRLAANEGMLAEYGALYKDYQSLEAVLSRGTDKALREREADILRYEIEEIENAKLKPGEEEELLDTFRRMKSFSKIQSLLAEAENNLDTDCISYAVRDVGEAANYDDSLMEIKNQLSEVEGLLDDARRSVGAYVRNMDFDEAAFAELENRLDVIHRMQGKYGDDIQAILDSVEDKKERLSYLDDYDGKRDELLKKKAETAKKMDELCDKLSKKRKKIAGELIPKITKQLEDMSFLGVDFGIDFESLKSYAPDGRDSVQFMISTNPGNPRKPIKDIASGGELSRIMLALKTVLADTDDTDTLVFDEIDAGISGRTAQAVAEKLSTIGKNHQVLCITHLAQIAAMADTHYLIAKSTDGITTRTDIEKIDGSSITEELARLMGGTDTETAKQAAREMQANAAKYKVVNGDGSN